MQMSHATVQNIFLYIDSALKGITLVTKHKSQWMIHEGLYFQYFIYSYCSLYLIFIFMYATNKLQMHFVVDVK